uniref:substrate-binding domain-containing protein n=1 Tax=Nonomuraea rhizosphaerae TaxID=2665663 RepID=UPI001C5ED96F
ELAGQLGEQGRVVVLQGVPGTSASRERGQGFAEGIAAYPEIQVVARRSAGFDRAKGLTVMTGLLRAHPGISGVFAENDEMALGAIKALGDRAGGDVAVVGFDGTPAGLKAVRAGTMAATVVQQPALIGRQAVSAAVKAARGERIDPAVGVPVKVATERNVSEFTRSS